MRLAPSLFLKVKRTKPVSRLFFFFEKDLGNNICLEIVSRCQKKKLTFCFRLLHSEQLVAIRSLVEGFDLE